MARKCEHPDGCDNPHDAKGWCKMHVRRALAVRYAAC